MSQRHQRTLEMINDNSLHYIASNDIQTDLIVTSPPYPFIEMWDNMFDFDKDNDVYDEFQRINERITNVLMAAFGTLRDGGIACINMGNAYRNINGQFMMLPNIQKLYELSWCNEFDLTLISEIIWRKISRSPNKFLGSGLYPCNAYVTNEHEYIVIFRKGKNRQFKTDEEKQNRRESAFFYQERNQWFSDLWEINGEHQSGPMHAAFPAEIPFRLINMFSVRGDVVFDPFAGYGTTGAAAVASGRDAICVEMDANVYDIMVNNIDEQILDICERNVRRISEYTQPNNNNESKQLFQMTHYDRYVYNTREADILIDHIVKALDVETEETSDRDRIRLFLMEKA